jgi:RsiW-degrading membrane proteinase PrsW (M82 family)
MSATLKMLASATIFTEVGVFAYLPYLYPKLHANKTITVLIGCFTCGLFMGLSLLHVLPESNHDI